jgi:hypothetical protein
MIGTHHPTIPREARHATLAHGSRHSIRGALWVREGRGWPPCWGGGVACAHTPNIASQPSAHHCLKSTTKTNTNQYIGQIRPLENHKAHKSAQAPKFRLGLPERSMGDLSGRPSRNFGAWALQTDFGQNIVFLGPWNCHTKLAELSVHSDKTGRNHSALKTRRRCQRRGGAAHHRGAWWTNRRPRRGRGWTEDRPSHSARSSCGVCSNCAATATVAWAPTSSSNCVSPQSTACGHHDCVPTWAVFLSLARAARRGRTGRLWPG